MSGGEGRHMQLPASSTFVTNSTSQVGMIICRRISCVRNVYSVLLADLPSHSVLRRSEDKTSHVSDTDFICQINFQ